MYIRFCCSNHSKEHVSSGVRVTRSLVLCICFVDRYLSFCIRFLIAAVITIEEHVYQILGHCDI